MDKKMLRRTRVFFSLVILLFVLLAARLAYLQVIQYEYYWNRAEKNRFRIMPVTAPRGEIFGREGEQLVTNRPGFTVSLVDLGSGYSDETIARLGELLEMSEEEIRERIRSQYYSRYMPIRLKTDVPEETVAVISEKRLELPGVLIEVQPIRNYVLDSFAPHILGYLGSGTAPDWVVERWAEEGYEDYRPGEMVGQSGLERVWEPYLRGQDGGVQVEVNSTGQSIREFERVEPVPGHDIFLTLDIPLQKKMEKTLEETVEYLSTEEGNARAGEAAAVALDPNTGRILAMASIPSYNPNTFRDDIAELQQDNRQPLVNKTIQDHYPVGSVFKMATAIAALQEGEVARSERVTCRGSLTRFNATKSCFRGTVHGPVNIVDAIQRSCNVFFYEMGLRVGIDKLSHYSYEFGFGSPTGLQDVHGERSGIVASREYKDRIYQEQWYPAETMDAAIGQSFQSITPLQLANYTSMLANGGIHYRPYLVEKVINSEGQTVMLAEPEILNEMDVQEAHWNAVQEGMAKAVLPGGTAARLADITVPIAGKTGTAQVTTLDRDIPSHSLFVSYAPVNEPEIALAVFVKHGGTGGVTAAPVAQTILDYYFGAEEEEIEDIDALLEQTEDEEAT